MLVLLAALLSTPVHAEESWNTLRSSEARATSFLRSNWNRFTENYHPTYVLDGDPATAWVEGADGNGEGESLVLPVSALRKLDRVRLRIRNGYQKSAGLLAANAAPKDVVIHLLDSAGHTVVRHEATLTRELGWQEVVVPAGGKPLDAVRIEVASVHPGSRYKDTCISDVLVDVQAADAYDADAEARKLAAAKGWIAERVKAAAFFAGKPAAYPFALTSFEQTQRDVPTKAEVDLAFADVLDLRAKLAKQKRYRVTHTTRLAHPPEGAWHLEDTLQYYQPANLSWFETDDDLLVHDKIAFNEAMHVYWEGEFWRYADRVLWPEGSRSRPAHALVRVRKIIEERGTYESDTSWVLSYDAEGRVTQAFMERDGEEEFDFAVKTQQLFRFTHDAEGRITGWDMLSRHVGPDWDKAFDAEGNPVDTPPTQTTLLHVVVAASGE
jgi:hypothetical protein